MCSIPLTDSATPTAARSAGGSPAGRRWSGSGAHVRRTDREAGLVRGRPLSAAVLGLVTLIGSGCSLHATSTTTTATARRSTTSLPATTTTRPAQTTISLFFIRGASLGVAHRAVNAAPNPRSEGVQALLAGPSPTEAVQGFGTDIPSGTALRGLEIRGGVATITLSPAFVSPDSPPVEAARLGQIVYTLTGYPNVDRVSIRIGTVPLTEFAGINLTNPVGRDQVTGALPAVLLESPAVGDTVAGSLQLSGVTSFSGTYEIQLTDSTGRQLAGVTNTAVVGGTFSQAIPFTVPGPTTGTLAVFARPKNPAQPPQAFSLTLAVEP